MDSFKDDKHMKAIHVIILSDSAIKVGRSNKVDMVIDHDSVSRQHATINFVRGRVVIRDLKSKYGSYALMKCPVLIKKYSLCFKTKRTLINIGLCKIEDYEKSKKDTRDDTTNLKKDIMHGLI